MCDALLQAPEQVGSWWTTLSCVSSQICCFQCAHYPAAAVALLLYLIVKAHRNRMLTFQSALLIHYISVYLVQEVCLQICGCDGGIVCHFLPIEELTELFEWIHTFWFFQGFLKEFVQHSTSLFVIPGKYETISVLGFFWVSYPVWFASWEAPN